MGYYLTRMDFVGSIPKKNIDKLTDDFKETFEIEYNKHGDIIDIWKDDLKLNFEDEINLNSEWFKEGSYFEMVGEDGELFRWIINKEDDGYDEIYPIIVWPSYEDGTNKSREVVSQNGEKYIVTIEKVE